MTVDWEVSVGDLLTTASVLLSVAALAYGWREDRQMRRKEYADRIRRAAGSVAAKLERWQGLALRFFDDIQPLLVRVDNVAVDKQNASLVRDELWQGLYEQRAATSQRIADEQIEIAYIDLYGYNPRIQELFVGAVDRLKAIENGIFEQTVDLTQQDILEYPEKAGKFGRTEIGNVLRWRCATLAREYQQATYEVITAFRTEILKLIEADDTRIFQRSVSIASVEEVLGSGATPVSTS